MSKYFMAFSILFIAVQAIAQDPRLIVPVGHSGPVNSVRYSKDGSYVVTAGSDNTARIWSVSTGKLIIVLKGQKDRIQFADFNSTDEFIVSVSKDSTIYIWETFTGKVLRILQEEGKYFKDATFNPIDNNLITLSSDGIIKVWEVSRGKEIKSFSGTKSIISMNCSNDGRFIAGYCTDSTLKVWNYQATDVLSTIPSSYSKLTSIKISPNNQYLLAIASDSLVNIWNLDGTIIRTLRARGRISSDSISSHGWGGEWKKHYGNVSGRITSASFSSDGNYIFCNTDFESSIWQFDNGSLVTSRNEVGDIKDILDSIAKTIRSIDFSPDGNKYVISNFNISNDSNVIIKEIFTGKAITNLNGSLRNENGQVTNFIDNDHWVMGWGDQSYLYNFKNGQIQAEIPGFFAISADKKYYLERTHIEDFGSEGSRSGGIKIGEFKTGRIMSNIDVNTVIHADISHDNKNILTISINDDTIKIWSLNSGKLIHAFKVLGDSVYKGITYAIFSPDNKNILVSGDKQPVKIVNAQNGLITKTFDAPPFYFPSRYSSSGKYIITSSLENEIKIWSTATGLLYKKIEAQRYQEGDDINIVSIDDKDQFILTSSTFGIVRLYSFKEGKLLNSFNEERQWTAFISPDGNFLVFNSENGFIRIWNIRDQKYLYSIIPLTKEKDFLAFDNNGRFDGTQKARNTLYYVCNKEIIDLEQFKDLLWEPNLISKIMGTDKEPITAKKLSEINICNYSPKVEERGHVNGKYNFEIFPGSGGIGEVLLYVNDKNIKSYSPTQLLKKNEVYHLAVSDIEIKDYLVSGQENKVEVVALTADKEMKSQRGAITVTDQLDPDAPVHLYAISIGISKYKDDKLKLKYASKDADDFAGVLSKSAKKFLNIDTAQHVFSYTFSTNSTDNWPSKENIKKTFEEVAKKATADDILVLFFAGHGTLRSVDRQFYFLTQEASSLGISGVEKEVAISTEELNDWMRNIKAQKQILVLDACSSGEVVTDMQQLLAKREIPADQQRALERLKDRTGTYILSASASGQSAYESGLYEQGLLTYGLLSGLKYGSGLKDNKFIDVTRWFNSAADAVKILATDIGGRQDPQIIGSASFDVGIVDKSISDSIQLTSKKKVFKRSRFIGNQALLSDDLDVSSMLDKELNELSFQGMESPLVYVDDNNYSDAYSLRGTYTLKNNQIFMSISLFKGRKDRLYQFEVKGKVEEKEELVTEIINKIKDFIEK